MTMNNKINILLVLLLLTSCAALPYQVKPKPTEVVRFTDTSCPALQEQQEVTEKALRKTKRKQRLAYFFDSLGVLLVGLPFGSIVGLDNEERLAELKGESVALETIRENFCTN